jgi:hypothetical protein
VGIRLIIEVFDHAPAELTPTERLLLLALAESARDDTRTCWPSMKLLTRRTGLQDRSVRKAFTRLAERGYEVRMQAGTDKHGNPTYAHTGRATVYRLPDFCRKAEPQGRLKGGTTGPPSGKKGGTTGPERRNHSSGKAEPQFPPPLIEPSGNPHIPRERADDEITAVIRALKNRTGKTIDEHHATLVIKQLEHRSKEPIRHRIKYFTGAIAQDPNPRDFLPTGQPPPVHEVLGIDPPNRSRKEPTPA